MPPLTSPIDVPEAVYLPYWGIPIRWVVVGVRNRETSIEVWRFVGRKRHLRSSGHSRLLLGFMLSTPTGK